MADLFKAGEAKRAKGEYVEAVISFKMAADTGYVPAILALAQANEKGQGVPKNLDQASALYRLAAEKGEAAAAAEAERTKKGEASHTLFPPALDPRPHPVPLTHAPTTTRLYNLAPLPHPMPLQPCP